MIESPTALTDRPDTGVAVAAALLRAAEAGWAACRCVTWCTCRLTGGGISRACREPRREAACPPSAAVDADAKSFRLPARQSATVTASVLPRTMAARLRGLPGVRGSRGRLCFAIRNVC